MRGCMHAYRVPLLRILVVIVVRQLPDVQAQRVVRAAGAVGDERYGMDAHARLRHHGRRQVVGHAHLHAGRQASVCARMA